MQDLSRLSRKQRDLLIGYYYSEGVSQENIRSHYFKGSITKGEISKALGRLRSCGKLHTEHILDLDHEERNILDKLTRDTELEKKFLKVVKWSTNHDDPICIVKSSKSDLATVLRLTQFAARKVLSVLNRNPAASIGLSFGRSIDMLAKSLLPGNTTFEEASVFSIAGEIILESPLEKDDDSQLSLFDRYLSSSIVVRASETLKTQKVFINQLPHFMPLVEPNPEKAHAHRTEFLNVFSSYTQFQKVRSFLENGASLLISGIGPQKHLETHLKLRRVDIHQPEIKKLLNKAVGEVSGLPLYPNRSPQIDIIAESILSLQLSDLERAWAKAMQDPETQEGVLILAMGKKKANVLRVLLESYNIANQLIIDQDLALQIIDDIKQDAGTRS